jgi:hypothetical protein
MVMMREYMNELNHEREKEFKDAVKKCGGAANQSGKSNDCKQNIRNKSLFSRVNTQM